MWDDVQDILHSGCGFLDTEAKHTVDCEADPYLPIDAGTESPEKAVHDQYFVGLPTLQPNHRSNLVQHFSQSPTVGHCVTSDIGDIWTRTIYSSSKV